MSADDTAIGVHSLAIPHHVTMRAECEPDAFGHGHHYLISGVYHSGEQAFPDQVVSGSSAGSASEAIRVQLGRFRERGW